MKYTNKWMVVPFNPNYLEKSKDSVSNQLTQALQSSTNPIEKLNNYNQILAKSKEQHHPVVPKQEKVNESSNEEKEEHYEEDEEDDERSDVSMTEISMFTPNLFLPPPTVIPTHYTPKNTSIVKTRKSKVPAPYPQSVKKTRGFTFYDKYGYYERPEYNENNPKKRKIIELDKSIWSIFRN